MGNHDYIIYFIDCIFDVLIKKVFLFGQKLALERKVLSFSLSRLPWTSLGRTDQHITDLETKCYR